jgi:hypothetical protein
MCARGQNQDDEGAYGALVALDQLLDPGTPDVGGADLDSVLTPRLATRFERLLDAEDARLRGAPAAARADAAPADAARADAARVDGPSLFERTFASSRRESMLRAVLARRAATRTIASELAASLDGGAGDVAQRALVEAVRSIGAEVFDRTALAPDAPAPDGEAAEPERNGLGEIVGGAFSAYGRAGGGESTYEVLGRSIAAASERLDREVDRVRALAARVGVAAAIRASMTSPAAALLLLRATRSAP